MKIKEWFFQRYWNSLSRRIKTMKHFDAKYVVGNYWHFDYRIPQLVSLEEKKIKSFVLTVAEHEIQAIFKFTTVSDTRELTFNLKKDATKADVKIYDKKYLRSFIKKLRKLKKKPQLAMIHLYKETASWTYD